MKRQISILVVLIMLMGSMGCAGTRKANKSIYHKDGLIGKSNNKGKYHAIYYCTDTKVKKTYWYKPGSWKLFNNEGRRK